MTGRLPAPQWVAAELHIKSGYLAGDGADQPRAFYSCHRCGVTEGPVYGVPAVRIFAEQVKTVHGRRCLTRVEESAGDR